MKKVLLVLAVLFISILTVASYAQKDALFPDGLDWNSTPDEVLAAEGLTQADVQEEENLLGITPKGRAVFGYPAQMAYAFSQGRLFALEFFWDLSTADTQAEGKLWDALRQAYPMAEELERDGIREVLESLAAFLMRSVEDLNMPDDLRILKTGDNRYAMAGPNGADGYGVAYVNLSSDGEASVPDEYVGEWTGRSDALSINLSFTVRADGTGMYSFEQRGYTEAGDFTFSLSGDVMTLTMQKDGATCGGTFALNGDTLTVNMEVPLKSGKTYVYTAICQRADTPQN